MFRFVLLSVICAPALALATVGRFSVVTKEVIVTKPSRPEKAARRGLAVNVGDRIRTGKESYAKITMNDKNVLHVGPEAEFVIEKYKGAATGPGHSVLSVIYGRVRSSLEQKYDGKVRRFNVRTEAAIMGVRGTDFLVEHALNKSTTRSLVFESQVAAAGIDANGNLLGEQLISGGEVSNIVKGSPPTPPVKIPLDLLQQFDVLSKGAQSFSLMSGAVSSLFGVATAGAALEEKKEEPPQEEKKKEEKKEEKKPEEKPQEKAEEKPEEKKEEPKKEDDKPEEKEEKTEDESQEEPEKEGDEDDEKEGLGIDLKAGNLGGTVALTYPLWKGFRLRLEAFHTFDEVDGSQEQDEGDGSLSYEPKFELGGFGVVGEVGSGFLQLVGGAYFLGDRTWNVNQELFGSTRVGNTTYNFVGGDSFTAEGQFSDSIAPYLGLGMRIHLLGLLRLTAEVGALFLGRVEIDQISFGGNTAVAASDVDTARQNIEEDSEEKYNAYPMVRLGLTFRF